MEVFKDVRSSEYYYGCNASEFKDMKYIDALHYKIKKATELKQKLAEKQSLLFQENQTSEEYAKITQRIADIEKAIIFNKKLILEAEGK